MANTPFALSSSSGLTNTGRNVGGIDPTTALPTGDLRRKYDFSERFGELALDQTPFFRLVSSLSKKPTDDPEFKFTEKRQSFMKRYAYVVGWAHSAGNTAVIADAQLRATDNLDNVIVVGDTVKLLMAGDYKSAGNIQNISGNLSSEIRVASGGTSPEFFLQNQILKVPMSSTANGGAMTDYLLVRIISDPVAVTGADLSSVGGVAGANSEYVRIEGTVLRASGAAVELASFTGNAADMVTYNAAISGDSARPLETKRTYVVGNSFAEGSSLLGKQWKDNPYSTGYGATQIFRTEFGMTNTARATALKYEPNEWARIWKDKLIEHKWDIEHAGLFSTQYKSGDVQHTQGAVDYVLNYGNLFTLNTATKTIDDFLDDMSKYQDPRYNQDKATVYLCSTAVYTWLHKLGGFFKNNIGIGQTNAGASNAGNVGLFGADLAMTGRKKVMGLDVTTFSTVYGDMNVSRCIALDGSQVKILAVNMNNVAYRPLVGNGVNRDTSIYVGVQNLENSGIDKRVDMILTEAGFEYKMPESHAIWT